MEDKIKICVRVLEVRDVQFPVEINTDSTVFCEVSFDNQKFKTKTVSCAKSEWFDLLQGFSANELTVQLFTIPTVSGFQTAFNFSHKASPTLVGSLILPIDELFTGEAFDHWLEITREDPVKHEDISVGEMHLHIIVVTKLFDHNRELTPRLERTGVLKGTTYKMLSASSDSLDSVIKTSVPSLNLALYTSSENSAKPTLSFVLASSRGNGPHINKDQIISQDTEAMIGVLTKYKCKSSGSLAIDVSSTIVECFKTLLQRTDLQSHFAEDIRDFADTRKAIEPNANILDEYCELKFAEQTEDLIIDKIITSGEPTSMEMREVVQQMVIFILTTWGFPSKVATSYAMSAFTKRYEDGILKGISLTGWGKKMFPLWQKVVLATGVTVYCCLKDTYIQYIINYVTDGKAVLSKLPNPDYYGKLGGACFDTLVHRMKKLKVEDQHTFLGFVFKHEFSITKPTTETKLCSSFVKYFAKLEQPFNKEKYISGFNFVSASTAKVQVELESTSKVVLRESIKQAKKMQRSQTTRSWGLTPSGSSDITATRRSSVSSNISRSTETSQDLSSDVSSETSLMDSQTMQEEIKRLTERILSGKKDVVYSKREGISLTRNNSKLDRQFQLFIVEPSLRMCIHLYNYFYTHETVNIINGSYTQLEDDYDCLIFTGNAFGLPEPTKSWAELEGMLDSNILHKIRSTIVKEYMGEMPIGSALILKTNHPKVRLLIYSAGYQLKETRKNTYSYTCLWTVFMTIYKYNEKKIKKFKKFRRESGDISKPIKQPKFDLIKTVVLKGNFVNDGDEVAAEQIFNAWDQYNFYLQHKKPLIETWADAVGCGDKTIASKEKTPEEKKRVFDGLLISGALERRGFIDTQGVETLCEYLLDADSDELKQIASASALSAYAFPEKLPGIRDMIFQKGCLEPLLKLASLGKLSVHNEINSTEITVGDHVADGATGRVYKGTWKETQVAVKVSGENFLGFNREEFLRELAIMSMLRHKNVLWCLGASTMNIEELMIVTEWVTNGTLRNLLENNSIDLTWPMQMSLASQIAKGLEFIHSMHLIHCDIKSYNIMLGDNLVVKIIDFGNSRIVGSSSEDSGALGTTQWMAQEVLMGSTYTQKSDIYSYGIVLWEILTKKLPFQEMQLFDIPAAVMRGERPAIPKDAPSRFAQLISSCWQTNPSKRPSFVQINEELSKIGEEYHLYI